MGLPVSIITFLCRRLKPACVIERMVFPGLRPGLFSCRPLRGCEGQPPSEPPAFMSSPFGDVRASRQASHPLSFGTRGEPPALQHPVGATSDHRRYIRPPALHPTTGATSAADATTGRGRYNRPSTLLR